MDNISLIAFVLVWTAATLLITLPTTVIAQMSNSTGTPSVVKKEEALKALQLKRIFGDIFVSEVASKCIAGCVDVEYSGPSLIVLNGDYLIFNSTIGDYAANQFLWKGVENLKSRGFTIDSVALGGVGSGGNPNVYHIIMSRK
jgi:hypothetical protein